MIMSFDPVSFLLGSKSGGGGQPASSPWTKLAEQDFEVSTTSTSETTVADMSVPGIGAIASAKEKYIWVFVRDKAGKRNGYYYGNDYLKLNNSAAGQAVYVKSNGTLDYSSYQYGIYVGFISTDSIRLLSRYVSNFGTMDGTFHVEVWALDYPTGISSMYS